MEINLDKMVYEIFNKFINIDKAKTWEIGTDFSKTWERMHYKLKNINFDSNYPTKIEMKKIDENKFQLIINDNTKQYNITPTKDKNYWSEAGVRQFLQEGQIFDFLSWKRNTNDDIPFEIFIMPKFWDIKNWTNPELSIMEICVNSLIKSIKSDFQYIKNFGLSTFLYIAYLYEQNQNKIFPTNQLIKDFEVRMKSQKKNKTEHPTLLGSKNIKTYIKHYAENKNTYIICKKIIKTYDWEYIVNRMYCTLKDLNYLEFINQNDNIIDNKNINTNNRVDNIQTIRNRIRNEVKNNRQKILNITIKDYNNYSDLENSPRNTLRWDLLDACHILDIYKIKNNTRKLQNNQNNEFNEYYKQAIDPNNCLMLNKETHTLFDRGWIYFDTNGILNIKYDYNNSDKENTKINQILKDNVKKIFGLIEDSEINKVRINPKIWNNEMLNYLKAK